MVYNESPDNRLRSMVDEILDSWRAGATPNALAVLDEHPPLRERHSLAVDLAYEEYCLREESGEALDAQQFCNKFSRFRGSLARMLNLHRVLKSVEAGGLGSLETSGPGGPSLPKAKPKQANWPVAGNTSCGCLLLEELGRGAFSRVFLAEEPAIGNRKVVVKCSNSGPGEAFVLGKMAHPHVMPIHWVQQDEQRGLVGICMPFQGRVTLAEAIDRLQSNDHAEMPGNGELIATQADSKNPLAYSLAVARLIEKVARGLAAAHEAGVLHGDIKPSNIILSFAGEPLLVDFNLSDDRDHGPLRIGGTPPYMAPERLPVLSLQDDADAETDFRSDIFSLGVVLCELLYGNVPYEFEIEDLQVKYYANDLQTSDRLNLAGRAVPLELAEIIERAIALDPAERFASADDLADALAAFFERYIVKSVPQPASRIGRFAAIFVLICSLAGLVFAGVSAAYQRSPTQQLLIKAMQDLEEKDYVSASERFERLQKQVPRREFLAWQGWCYAQMGQFEFARKNFQRGDPKNDATGILWHNIGSTNLMLGAPELAIADFSKAIVLDPNNRSAYRRRAVAKARYAMLVQSEPLKGTIEDIESAMEDRNVEPYLYYDAARIYAFVSKSSPELEERCRWYIRRALEAGVPPEKFDGVTFQGFDITELTPDRLPRAATSPKAIDAFRPLPFDLQDVLRTLP